MKISIELFLLDNFMMNYLVYALSCVLIGTSVRLWRIVLSSIAGAVFALLFMMYPFPPLLRLLLLPLIALPLFKRGIGLPKTVCCIFISCAIVAGATLLLTLAFGGSVSYNGVICGTIRLRTALLCFTACTLLPRMFRGILRTARVRRVRLVCIVSGERIELDAMVDSGNLVREPLSGLPVILVSHDIKRGVCPIPYCTQGGDGVLWAARTEVIYIDGVEAPPAFVAKAPRSVKNADAIVPLSIIPEKEKDHEKTGLVCAKALAEAFFETCRTKQFGLHAFGRNTAPAAQPRRGSPSCRGDAAGRGGTGKADSSQS